LASRFASLLLAAVFVTAAASSARADDAADADALFGQAKALLEAGKATEACPKLEASYELDARLGTLVNLADCHERASQPARAFVRWREASRWPARDDERVALATSRMAELEPRIGRVMLEVTAGSEALAIALDDVPLTPATYAESIVAPGPHAITVLRGETVLERHEITVAPGERKTLPVDLGAVAQAHPVPKKIVAPPVPEPVPTTQRDLGFVFGGVGLGAVATFGGLEIAALAVRGSAFGPGGCSEGNVCTPQGFDRLSTAGDLAEAGQWVGLAGAGLLVVGMTLLLTAPSEPAAPRAPAVVLQAGALAGGTSFGFSLGGAL
jgi:hypothetical protein